MWTRRLLNHWTSIWIRRRGFVDEVAPGVPDNALLAEDGDPLLDEDEDNLVTET